MRKNLSKTQILAESAIMVALSIAVFLVSDLIPWPFLYGGGFSLFGQVPLIIVSYRHGIKNGIAASLALAIFEMIMGYKNFVHVTGLAAYLTVALADYIIAFGCLGLGGMFKGKFNGRQSLELALGGTVVCIIRFICHYISGVTIWKDYCPEGMAVELYSFFYNGSYMAVELVLTVIGLIAVGKFINLDKKKLI
ncbi:MAG: energy-coupled thiamine transporter ThiT [Clostridia bacterium]|nr:energy-coupled thiamine transporter ThiT [Clostridia bacterium]MBQ7122945.1 energy-coupled thiamine transporter ThiT [Clostridia bacterium]